MLVLYASGLSFFAVMLTESGRPAVDADAAGPLPIPTSRAIANALEAQAAAICPGLLILFITSSPNLRAEVRR